MFNIVHQFRKDVARDATRPIVRSASASSARVVDREGIVKDGFNIIAKREYVKPASLVPLAEEADELVRIFNASISTARKRLANDE